MVDTPTTRNRLRKQELGSNTNTWGDTKLNEVLDGIDQAMDGVLSITLTSDYTLSTVNYTVADEGKRRVLKFTGSLSSAVSVTIPSLEHEYAVMNAAGAAVTVKTFAGVGVEIPTGYQARVYCDGIDVFNGSPTVLPGSVRVAGKIRNVTAGTESTDAVNKTQMESAIALAAIPATPGTVRNSSGDTTAGYLSQKIAVTGSLVLTTLNPGANEQAQISFTLDEGQTALYAGVMALWVPLIQAAVVGL